MDVIGHVPMSLSVEYVLDAGQKLIAHTEEVLKHAGGDNCPERIGYFAARMVERGVWMIPTLFEYLGEGDRAGTVEAGKLTDFSSSKRILSRTSRRHPRSRAC